MMILAVILDVYGTLLEVGPPPADADARWDELFQEALGEPPGLSRTEFAMRCGRAIAGHHAAARARGILWPEIYWPTVALEVLPALARLAPRKLETFLFRQMQIGRTVRLAPHAAPVLLWLQEHSCALGIASNAQGYTRHELDLVFRGTSFNFSMCDPDLCFWSFKHGFSKPDPHVFQLLSARLENRGIRPAETLAVGDRLDNDIEPARAFGWQTWHLSVRPASQPGGTWEQLGAWLKGRLALA